MTTYAEAESVMVAALKVAFPTARVLTETPDNLADVLPCIRVARFGGAEDYIYTFDNATMDFDCFAATRGEARTLAHAVRTWVRRDLPGQTISYDDGNGGTASASVSRTRTFSGPVWTPYENTNVRRFTYSAAIRLHVKEPSA